MIGSPSGLGRCSGHIDQAMRERVMSMREARVVVRKRARLI
jgi:hypothetical protein